MDPSERGLLEACRQGSCEARERFARRYAGLIHWAIRKTLGERSSSRVDPVDVFQDVFRKIFEPGTLDAVRNSDALKSWLVVLSCRTALDAARSGKRVHGRESSVEELAPGVLEVSSPPLAPSALNEVLDDEKKRVVHEVVGALPPREQACVRYHYLEGWTHSRIGQLLGLPENTVATIIRRSREGLRKALEGRGYEK